MKTFGFFGGGEAKLERGRFAGVGTDTEGFRVRDDWGRATGGDGRRFVARVIILARKCARSRSLVIPREVLVARLDWKLGMKQKPIRLAFRLYF